MQEEQNQAEHIPQATQNTTKEIPTAEQTAAGWRQFIGLLFGFLSDRSLS